jgi:excisionase family DNA binding protein
LPARERLERLAADLPALWLAPSTAHRDRKRLLRTLVADVTVLPESDPGRVRIGIRWHSGAADELHLLRPQSAPEQRRTDPAVIAFVRELGATRSNAEVADALNAAGLTTGFGRAFDRAAVTNLRHYHRLPPEGVLHAGEMSVSDVARRLGISYGSVNYWIRRGWLEARRAHGGRWAVPFNTEVEAACRARISASRQLPHADPQAPPRQPHERSVKQVASALKVHTDVVYYWLQRGHLTARQDSGGRWCIPFPAEVEAACQQRVNDSTRITKPRNG